ncbi:MoaF-related domain-containing protein [Rhizobium leguminosarum]|uniref:MoaF-related domain-containing protein n=1 Tax=Rhizobium leguminosarum TaxID=384 RepID=UPI00396568B3
MCEEFPAIGHRYLVDFKAFRVELNFHSAMSLTYTGVKPDGSPGTSETVAIAVNPIRDLLFLVTWQEADKTTVVHLEDYKSNAVVTHITGPDSSFSIFHGTMRQIS